MPSLGAPELLIVLILALLVFGPGKLPEVGSALGRSFREFRAAAESDTDNRADEHA
jgi:sec-independent protein translocase protein TatA